jgi:hypothetical protein
MFNRIYTMCSSLFCTNWIESTLMLQSVPRICSLACELLPSAPGDKLSNLLEPERCISQQVLLRFSMANYVNRNRFWIVVRLTIVLNLSLGNASVKGCFSSEQWVAVIKHAVVDHFGGLNGCCMYMTPFSQLVRMSEMSLSIQRWLPMSGSRMRHAALRAALLARPPKEIEEKLWAKEERKRQALIRNPDQATKDE